MHILEQLSTFSSLNWNDAFLLFSQFSLKQFCKRKPQRAGLISLIIYLTFHCGFKHLPVIISSMPRTFKFPQSYLHSNPKK